MSTRYRYGFAVFLRDLTQKHTAFDRRDAALFGGNQLRVITADGGCIDEQFCIAEVIGKMPFVNVDAQTFQTVNVVRFALVRAGDGIAELVQNFGKRTHSRTADADKVYTADVIKRGCHGIAS